MYVYKKYIFRSSSPDLGLTHSTSLGKDLAIRALSAFYFPNLHDTILQSRFQLHRMPSKRESSFFDSLHKLTRRLNGRHCSHLIDIKDWVSNRISTSQ